MKKALMIVVAMAIVIITCLTTGCFIQENIELNKIKEEIIKFDEEYWKIAKEWVQWQEEGSKSTDETISDDEVVSNFKKYQEDYAEDILKFKSINIPKPLDEFYYKKIEQFNSIQMSQSKISASVSINQLINHKKNLTEADTLLLITNNVSDKKISEELGIKYIKWSELHNCFKEFKTIFFS